MPPNDIKSRQKDVTIPPELDYLTVKEVMNLLKVARETITEALPDIPGAIRISERGIRIPRAGLYAWLKRLEVAR